MSNHRSHRCIVLPGVLFGAFAVLVCFSGCKDRSSHTFSNNGEPSPLALVQERLAKEPPTPVKSKQPKLHKARYTNSLEKRKPPGQPKHVLEKWPPRVNVAYPDLVLFNSRGAPVHLSSFRGRTILLEPIGMDCGACKAFSGGHKRGKFGNKPAQKGLDSIENYLRSHGKGAAIGRSGLILVQVIFYNLQNKAPTVADVQAWEEHYGFASNPYVQVLGATEDVRANSRKMIPGFQLIDRQFRLRFDSTGHRPKHDLFSELLPSISSL